MTEGRKIIYINAPMPVWRRLQRARKRRAQTAWVLEAIVEKLEREEHNKPSRKEAD